MNKFIYLVLILYLFGCTENEETITELKSGEGEVEHVIVGKEPSASFVEALKSTEAFGELYDLGKSQVHLNPQQALKYLERAYDLASNRSHQAMTLNRMAETYEVMGDNELAANFWEATAKMTLNEQKRDEYLDHAKELRKKEKVLPLPQRNV